MATINSDIIVRIRALVIGSAQVQSFVNSLRGLQQGGRGFNGVASGARNATINLRSLHNVGRQVALTFYSLGRAGHYLSTIIFALSGGMTVFLAALASITAAAAGGLFAFLIKEGIEFNSEIEQLRLGFASLLFSFANIKNEQGNLVEGQEKWNRSVELSQTLMEQLYIKTFQTNRTVDELAGAFQSGLAPALNAGLNLQQSLDVITRIVQAADVFRLKANEINEEVRNLLAGNATRDTRIAVALFGSASAANKAIEQARSQGKLFDLLTSKLEGFKRAGEELPKTFEGAFSNLRDLFKRIAGEISLNFKNELTKGFVEVFDRIVDTEKLKTGVFVLRPEFQRIFELVKKIADELAKRIPQALDLILTKTVQLFDYIESKGTDGTLANLKKLLDEISGLIGTIFASISTSDIPTGFLANVLQGAAAVIHVVRELLQLLNVIAAFIKVVLLGIIVGGATLILNLIARIIELIVGPNSVSDAMYSWATAAEGYLSSIIENLKRQFGLLLKLIDAYDTLTQKANGSTGTQSAFGGGGAGGGFGDNKLSDVSGIRGAGVGGGSGSRSRAHQRLRDELAALRELNKATSRARITDAQIEFERIRDEIKRNGEVWKQYYDDLRVGIEAFYSRRETLDRESTENEITLLRRKRDELDVDYQAEMDAIAESDASAKAKERRRMAALLNLDTKRKEIDAEIKAKQREQENNDRDNDRERRLAWKALGIEVEGVLADIDDAQERTAAAAASRIDAQFRDLLDKLRVNFTENGPLIKQVEKYIQFLKQQAVLEERMSKLDRLNRAQEIERSKLQDQLTQGKLTQVEYERELNRLNREALQLQEDELARAYLLAQTDEERLRIREKLQSLKETTREVNALADSINGALRDNIGSFADSIVDDFQNIGQNFRDMAIGIMQDIAKMLVRAVILQSIFKRLGILEGSTSGIGGGVSKIFGASGFAGGGFVDGPGTETSDSIVANLSRNEAVIPAKAVRRYGRSFIQSIISGTHRPFGFAGGFNGAPAGGASGLPPKVIVALNEDDIANASMSSQGERVWLYHFNKNRKALGFA